MRGEPLRTVEDLKGKKIRVGGNVTGRIIAALGGTPVQLPPTEAQQAMASGVADGITFPIELIEFFKITPVIKSTVLIPGGLYTDTFWLGINEAKWNALRPEQKAAVEKHSGMAVALLSGWAWTNGDDLGRAALERNKVVFATLPPTRSQQGEGGPEGARGRVAGRGEEAQPAGRGNHRLCPHDGRKIPLRKARQHSVTDKRRRRSTRPAWRTRRFRRPILGGPGRALSTSPAR